MGQNWTYQTSTPMKNIILITLIFFNTNLFAQLIAKDGLPSLRDKKVLIVYGGWLGHKPKSYVDKIKPWLEGQGAIVTLSDSLNIYTNEKVMAETDLIIQSWTMDRITAKQAKGLINAVKNGAGIAGCHGGLADSFRENVGYQFMIGGQWVAHPGGQFEYTVHVPDSDDPIVKGLKDFNIKTEQYYMHIDPNVKVLATTQFKGDHNYWIEGAVMPVAWKKHYGKGRVFYLSLGHNPKDFEVKEAWEMLKRGFRWAGGSRYQSRENLMYPVYSVGKEK